MSPCKSCGFPRHCFEWQTFANGTQHIRVTCESCHAFVMYAPQTPENLAAVGARPTVTKKPDTRGIFDGA